MLVQATYLPRRNESYLDQVNKLISKIVCYLETGCHINLSVKLLSYGIKMSCLILQDTC